MSSRNISRRGLVGKQHPLRTPNNMLTVPVIQRAEHLATISAQYSDGTTVADLPTGPYTYKNLIISVESDAEIVGKTSEYGGKHYVNTANLAEYVESVTLEIDGTAERVLDVATLVKLNAFHMLDGVNGFAILPFGTNDFPAQFLAEDAYMLGTADVKSCRLLFKLKAAWVDGSMNLRILSEHARVARPLEYISTFKSYRYSMASAGEHTITDLPISADIARLYVFSDNIGDIELRIDDQLIFAANSHEMAALNSIYGRDVAALGNGVLFDFWRERDVYKTVRALTNSAQRRRNADVRLTVNTLAADTEVRVMMQLCGRYSQQG